LTALCGAATTLDDFPNEKEREIEIERERGRNNDHFFLGTTCNFKREMPWWCNEARKPAT
jgi:hypothetical protein